MIPAEIPENENQRLAKLREFGILDTDVESSFDRITRIVADVVGVPISLVSLIDENRQWLKSRHGLDVTETPRDLAFCAHAILGDDVFVVEDALTDQRFFDNPLVTSAPSVHFYAGAPLITSDGYRLGTLCAIDTRPRRISQEHKALLQDLAGLVIDEIELRKSRQDLLIANNELQMKVAELIDIQQRLEDQGADMVSLAEELEVEKQRVEQLSVTDRLTGLFNRLKLDDAFGSEIDRAQRFKHPLSVILFDLDHFKNVNDTFGHQVGDDVLVAVAGILKQCVRSVDVAGRWGGEEFLVICPETNVAGAEALAEKIRQAIAAYDFPMIGHKTASFGVAEYRTDEDANATTVRADQALYKAKNAGRNRVVTETG